MHKTMFLSPIQNQSQNQDSDLLADSPSSCNESIVPRMSLRVFLTATRDSLNKNEKRKPGCSCGCGCKKDCGCGCGGKGGCGCSKKKKEKEKEKKKTKKYTEEDVVAFFVGTLRKSVAEKNLKMSKEEFKKLSEKMWREMPLHVLEKVIELFEENAHSEMTTERSNADTLVHSKETASCKTKKKYFTVEKRGKWNVTEKCMKCKSLPKIANTRKKGKSEDCKRKAKTVDRNLHTRQNAGTVKSKKAGMLKQKFKICQSKKKNTTTAKKHATTNQVKKIVNSKKPKTKKFSC